jgi:hypothetical protein
MRGKTAVVVLAAAIGGFVAGVFFSQPSWGQQKDEKPAAPAGPVGRFTTLNLGGGDIQITDTTSAQTWVYINNQAAWLDIGSPLDKPKKK